MYVAERWVVIAVMLIGVLVGSSAFAQDGPEAPAKPSEEQEQLNEHGVRALAEGDYVQAISMLEESLFLGELNIAYLNLGRAYQLAGRCQEARRTLQKVDGAPPIADPSPAFVNAKAEQYLEQLEESCEEASSAGDEGESGAGGGVHLEAEASASGSPWGLIATSTGGVLMASAVGMHFLWAEPIRDDARSAADGDIARDISQQAYDDAESRANSVDTIALITGITGGLVTGVGLYLWLSDEGPSQHALSVTPTRRGTSVTYRLRF